MHISETLNAAADHLELYGHRKAGLGAAGEPTCVIGALMVAADGSTEGGDGWYPAGCTLRAYLGGKVSIHHWNNAPERTASEVVEALRACAVIEASRERRPAAALVS